MRLLLLILIQFALQEANAQCSSPAGVAGQLQWITADSKVKFCNGSSWVDTTGATGASCSGKPTGLILYSTGDLSYCNGSVWISMKGGSLGSCSGAPAGMINWLSPNVRFCDGTNWYNMTAAACPSAGQLVGGSCWYAGSLNQSCTTVCSNVTLVYATATLSYAGSSGTDTQCRDVLDALSLGNTGAVPSNTANNRGCVYRPGTNARVRGTTATTAGSSNASDQRICACDPQDVTPNSIDWVNFNDTSASQTISAINVPINLELSVAYTNGYPYVEYQKNALGWVNFTNTTPATVSFAASDTLQFRVRGATNHVGTITVTNTSDGNAVLDTVTGTVLTSSDVVPDAVDWANFNDVSTEIDVTGIAMPVWIEVSVSHSSGTPSMYYRKGTGGSWVAVVPGTPALFSINNMQALTFAVEGTVGHAGVFTIRNQIGGYTMDTVTGTVSLACTGHSAHSGCFFLGSTGQNCYQACSAVGRSCDLPPTQTGGSTIANCSALLTALGLATTSNHTSPSNTYACAGVSGSNRYANTTPSSISCGASLSTARRACACRAAGASPPAYVDYGGYRYRYGAMGASCDTVCSSYGGCVAAGLAPANNSTACADILTAFTTFSLGSWTMTSGTFGCSWQSPDYYISMSAPTCATADAAKIRICSCAN